MDTLNGYRGATRKSCGSGDRDRAEGGRDGGGGGGGGSGDGGGGSGDRGGGDEAGGDEAFGVAAMLDSVSQRGAQNAEEVSSPAGVAALASIGPKMLCELHTYQARAAG